MKRFVAFASAVLIGLSGQHWRAEAQTSAADEVYRMCSPIMHGIISSETRLSQAGSQRDSIISYLCSLNYASEEQASSAGLDVSVPIEGVTIGAMFSSDSTRRSVARTKLCTASTYNRETNWGVVLREVRRDASVAGEYSRCVQSALGRLQDELLCYADSRGDTHSIAFTVGYQLRTIRTGKLVSAKLTGSLVSADDGKQDVSRYIRRFQRSPNAPLTPFKPFEIDAVRTGNGKGSLEIVLDDGQTCTARVSDVPISWDGEIISYGKWLGDTYVQPAKVGEMGKCDSNEDKVQEICFAEGTQMDSIQAMTQFYNASSNCPRDASNLTSITVTGNCARLNYNLQGCGFNSFPFGIKECKGRGWLEAKGLLRGRVVDHTRAGRYVYSFKGETITEELGYRSESGLIARPNDFTPSGWGFVLRVSLPDQSTQSGKRIVSLAGDDKAFACTNFLVGGKNSAVFAYLHQRITLIFGQAPSCEAARTVSAGLPAALVRNSPAAACANMREGQWPNSNRPASTIGPMDMHQNGNC